MEVVPKARARDPGVSQDQLVDSVCAELQAEGGSKKNATTRTSQAVSCFQRPLSSSRRITLLVNQFWLEQATTGVTRCESPVNDLALHLAVVRCLPGVPTHLQDEVHLWSLDTAVDCTGKGPRPEDKCSYRLQSRVATQVLCVVGEALA